MKRFISVLLAVILSIPLFGVTAYGDDGKYTKTMVIYNAVLMEEEVPDLPFRYDFSAFVDEVHFSQEDMEVMIIGGRTGLQPYVDTILEASVEYGLNPVFLLAQFGIESSWGTSNMFLTRNNIGGWKSGDGSYRYFESVEECIWAIAESLATEYANPNHWKYCGGDTVEDVLSVYCPSSRGYVELMYEIMFTLQTKAFENRGYI